MRKILLGMSAWGSYVDTFFRYTFPSLNAEGNLPALKKHFDVGFVVHTDKENAPRFAEKGMATFCDVGEGDKYEIIGRHQNHDLTLAKITGADYHCLMPDFVYSNNCFKGVLEAIKNGHKAITRLVVSTSQEEMSSALRPYFIDTLSISAEALATLSLKYIHPGIKHWLATKEGYPNTHVLAWEGRNTLHMCSPHQSPVYIANEVINPVPFCIPIDCILDQVIVGDIYCPKPDDGIVIVEISRNDSRNNEDKRIDLNEFSRIFKWDTKGSFRQLSIFNEETVDPICRRMLGESWYNDVEISIEKSNVVNALTQYMEAKNAVVR